MSKNFKIYIDTGANRKFLQKYDDICIYYQFPYDSFDRPKNKKPILAEPSELTWGDAHVTWEEAAFAWADCIGSDCFSEIEKIIGKKNRRDVCHLDSAVKSDCDIFLTSDRGDISSNKLELERICCFKIFCTVTIEEQDQIIEYIQQFEEVKKI